MAEIQASATAYLCTAILCGLLSTRLALDKDYHAIWTSQDFQTGTVHFISTYLLGTDVGRCIWELDAKS